MSRGQGTKMGILCVQICLMQQAFFSFLFSATPRGESRQLGPHSIVWIERNSHLNYVFAFPRFGVLPGHKNAAAYIPYNGIVTGASPKGVVIRVRDGEVVISRGEMVR